MEAVTTLVIFILGTSFTECVHIPFVQTCNGSNITLSCIADENSQTIIWSLKDVNNVQHQITPILIRNNPQPIVNPVNVQGYIFFVNQAISSDLLFNITFLLTENTRNFILLCLDPDQNIMQQAMFNVTDAVPCIHDFEILQMNSSSLNLTFVSLKWNAFHLSGGDTENIKIDPPPSHFLSDIVSTDEISRMVNVSLQKGVFYQINITAINCMGQTQREFFAGSCEIPSLQLGVLFNPLNGTVLGSAAIVGCHPGYSGTNFIATCQKSELTISWSPNPIGHNCTQLHCPKPPDIVNGFYVSTVEEVYTNGENLVYICSKSPKENISAICNNGSWIPDPSTWICLESVVSTKIMISPSTIMERKGSSLQIALGVGITAAIIIMLLILVGSTLVVCSRYKYKGLQSRRSSHSQHQWKDEGEQYSRTGHGLHLTDLSATDEGEQYSKTAHGLHLTDLSAATYSQLQSTQFKHNIGTTKSSNSNYAELVTGENFQLNSRPHMDNVVTYSQVKFVDETMEYKADALLNLNNLLMQIAQISQSWKQFGVSIGVPENIIQQIDLMDASDYDKLVEAMDYWLNMSSCNTKPSWKVVATTLQTIGFQDLASQILEVYVTGELPVKDDEDTKWENTLPPPLPPKDLDNCHQITSFHGEDSNNEMCQPPPVPPKMYK